MGNLRVSKDGNEFGKHPKIFQFQPGTNSAETNPPKFLFQTETEITTDSVALQFPFYIYYEYLWTYQTQSLWTCKHNKSTFKITIIMFVGQKAFYFRLFTNLTNQAFNQNICG